MLSPLANVAEIASELSILIADLKAASFRVVILRQRSETACSVKYNDPGGFW